MARSSGKVVLLGEHAVVYGVPAIAAGISRGATATADDSKRSTLQVGTRSCTVGDGSEEARAYGALLDALGEKSTSVSVTLEIPSGVGLGASAAIGVATTRAVLELRQPGGQYDDRLVLRGARAWETVFHGQPSGIDAAASCFGGCFKYTRQHGVKPLKVEQALTLAVGVAAPAASTRQMVESVAQLRQRKAHMVDKTLAGIESVVKNGVLCVESGDIVGLGKLFDLNQMLLAGLFISTEEIERACSLARDSGALGAKLTGAGGGGSVIALCEPDNAQPVIAAWERAGIDCFTTVIAETEADSTLDGSADIEIGEGLK